MKSMIVLLLASIASLHLAAADEKVVCRKLPLTYDVETLPLHPYLKK
ncbi:MAG: hypothetical protein JSR46_01480 [Verrucomicrobia bacterium]|nr:hypothetical protein [Verrucomicrobiota bacterium]